MIFGEKTRGHILDLFIELIKFAIVNLRIFMPKLKTKKMNFWRPLLIVLNLLRETK